MKTRNEPSPACYIAGHATWFKHRLLSYYCNAEMAKSRISQVKFFFPLFMEQDCIKVHRHKLKEQSHCQDLVNLAHLQSQ